MTRPLVMLHDLPWTVAIVDTDPEDDDGTDQRQVGAVWINGAWVSVDIFGQPFADALSEAFRAQHPVEIPEPDVYEVDGDFSSADAAEDLWVRGRERAEAVAA